MCVGAYQHCFKHFSPYKCINKKRKQRFNVQFLATEGAIPVFMQLTESPDLDLKNQAFWYLANTIGDTSVKLREIICCNGITDVLKREFEKQETPPEALLSNLVWCICNLFRYKPSPRYETMRWIFPHLKKCLDCKDENLIGDTLWTMAYARFFHIK